jgi:hypothetical protein
MALEQKFALSQLAIFRAMPSPILGMAASARIRLPTRIEARSTVLSLLLRYCLLSRPKVQRSTIHAQASTCMTLTSLLCAIPPRLP